MVDLSENHAMNVSTIKYRFTILLSLFLFVSSFPAFSNGEKPDPEYYQIRIYYFTGNEQENLLDDYLAAAWLPALHKAGIKNVGVFKPLANDTASIRKLYVFIPSNRLDKLIALPQQLQKDSASAKAARAYLDAAYNQPPFIRIETILLKAFQLAPKLKIPALTGDKKERIYELRSYEGPTENLYNKKVKMFNEGGEIALFDRLGFNAVFYASVISGSRMPNLMYMTSFDNRAERDAHWKTFSADPEWRQLSSLPEYKNTVSKAEIILLHATAYSDL